MVFPSSALAWSRKQRGLLHGRRFRHRFDPPPRDLGAEGWANQRRWVAAAAELSNESVGSLAGDVERVRAQYAADAPPGASPHHDEQVRLALVEACLEHTGVHPWKVPLPEAMAWTWAPIGMRFVVEHFRAERPFCTTHRKLLLEPSKPFRLPPFRFDSHSLGRGHRFWAAAREWLFSLPDDRFEAERASVEPLRDALGEDERWLRFALGYAFSRDPRWPADDARTLLSEATLPLGGDLVLLGLTDAAQATALIHKYPRDFVKYTWNVDMFLDLVEGLGSAAAPALRAMDLRFFKPRVGARIAELIKLAESAGVP